MIKAEPCSQDQFAGAKNFGDLSKQSGGRDQHGYKVVYENGYTSWSPKDVFEKAYRRIDNLTFGLAIEALKQGKCVARQGWNGKNMFVCKQVPAQIGEETIPKMQSLPVEAKALLFGGPINYENQMLIVNLNNRKADSWVASSSDIFAEDWIILE